MARPVGSWQGTSSQTIGFNSDTGRFRIAWQTRNQHGRGGGAFKLTVHSAVSGRPLQVVADHHGEGSGTTEFADDPRQYNLMVDSVNLDWSLSVEEIVVTEKESR